MTTERFDLTGELPGALLSIEASAGTGKTFTLAALATRFITEVGTAPSQLLIVTFTRAATSELRSRVRQQLVAASEHLGADGHPDDLPDDPLMRHLVDTGVEERLLRRRRAEQAVIDFDTATVTTIHGFATQVLGTLGVTAGTDLDATLVDDADELFEGVCADVLAAAAVEGHPPVALPKLEALRRAVGVALHIPDLDIVPTQDQAGADEQQRLLADLVRRATGLIGIRRRRSATLGFDDVLSDLRDALRGPGAPAVIDSLRRRFQVALIDEFQDTDPVQWDIFSTLFGGQDGTRLVLVGDPKQAIYSFRGADIRTYTDAVAPRPGLEARSLTTNWRADGAVVSSLNALFDGATFGDERIAYTRVAAAPEHEHLRIAGPDGSALPALSIRLALGTGIQRNSTPKANPRLSKDSVCRAVFEDLVEQVRALLDAATLPCEDADDPGTCGRRAVRPSDVAVLVRTTKEATTVHSALRAQGVPAVLARGGSVLESPAATQWRWLLDALGRPSDPARVRTFALSWFGGLDANGVERLTDEQLDELQEQLRDLADTLNEQGVNTFVQRVRHDTGVSARILARADGDRDLTDLDHIAELLIARHPGGGTGVAGLLAVVDGSGPSTVDVETDSDLLARRVETEQQAVQIMTIWVAKGLEFPIVCCPTLWSEPGSNAVYRSPETDRRTFDVTGGKPWPDPTTARARRDLAAAERVQENLRLAYVALTRSRHHTILWWSRVTGSRSAAATRLLFARTGGRIDPSTFASPAVPEPADGVALDALGPLLDAGGGTISAAVHGRPVRPAGMWAPARARRSDEVLDVARQDRRPDRQSCRWSFTAVTGRIRLDGTASDPVAVTDTGDADERPPEPTAEPAEDADQERPVDIDLGAVGGAALALLPAGAAIGTLVHAVLERVDFASEDLRAEVDAAVDDELAWRGVDLRPPGVDTSSSDDGRRLLVDGICSVIDTPLGPAFGGTALRELRRPDRLDEMPFEMRLATSGPPATDRCIGRLLTDHLPADDPLRAWATSLAAGAFDAHLAGHMTGSIDLVARVPSPDGGSRFVVVDYKSNRLHRRGRLPDPGDYGRDAMARAMAEHHYPLQALIYSVALHRYLRWRLVDYRPATHLGGIAYLFLRGMTGTDTSLQDTRPDGVFDWAVPPGLVTALSDLLDGQQAGGLER